MQHKDQPMNNMQPMSDMKMPMHDTFWRNDQVMVVFHSMLPLIKEGAPEKKSLLDEMDLPEQLKRINKFLFQKFREQGRSPIHLVFLDDNQKPAVGDRPIMRRFNTCTNSPTPTGVYAFDQGDTIKMSFGTFRTSIHAFLKIIKGPSPDIGDMSSESNETGNHHDDHEDEVLVPAIVDILNSAILDLNNRQDEKVPLAFSAPTWLSGGSQVGFGCPLTPPIPIPVADSCPYWHIELPDVDPQLPTTGDGVTVFVLDSFPERGVISRAARDAGNANWLLHTVDETVTFDYSLMSGVQEIDVMDHTNVASVGKDVYGEHYPILLPDHGLFIAGIVRDLAPKARIECVRVLNSLCVGEQEKITHALERIYYRMTDKNGDLSGKQVVINMSLVLPMLEGVEKVNPGQIIFNTQDFEIIPGNLLLVIRALQHAGAVIVAAAGNEGDGRELPTGTPVSNTIRPSALYPAALGKYLNNVIAVGAVKENDDSASYSCYAGSYPDASDPNPRAYGLAAWGGEVPNADLGEVIPPKPDDPGSNNPTVIIHDAIRGIYSSTEFPPLSAVPADPPEQYYTALNESAWAYWIGTSFATPIVSAVVARILESDQAVALNGKIYDTLVNTLSGKKAQWNRLDPAFFPGGKTEGPLLKVEQKCKKP